MRVHDLAQAEVVVAWAMERQARIDLATAPEAALYTGPLYWREIELALGRKVIVDCGDLPGPVMGALRAGLTRILFHGEPVVQRKLDGMAIAAGAEIRCALPSPVIVLAAEDDAVLIRRCLDAARLGADPASV